MRLILLLSLLQLGTPAMAGQDIVKWSGVNSPAEGEPGKWVLAGGSDSYSTWSAVGAFTTEPAPSPEKPLNPAPAPPSPTAPPLSNNPGWVKYMVGGLLLVIVMLLFPILTLVIIGRRP